MTDPSGNLETRVLCSLRRIIRAVDIYSNQLNARIGLTSPQLICLKSVAQRENSTLTMLTRDVNLSGSTVTGIVDRLEAKGLLLRERDTSDRRKVFHRATAAGMEIVNSSPSLLQEKFALGLGCLTTREQTRIAESLEQIVTLMEAGDIESPMSLVPGFSMKMKYTKEL